MLVLSSYIVIAEMLYLLSNCLIFFGVDLDLTGYTGYITLTGTL